MKILFVALFVCTAACSIAWAGDPELMVSTDAIFRRGNDAYFHGRYAEAVEAYEQVVALGVRSEDLYYNLGNAHFKAGQLGPAIYDYERALLLDPGQDDAQFNLKAAREQAKRRGEDRLVGAEGTPLWLRVLLPFTVGVLAWTFFSLWLGLFALLIALRFLPSGFLRVGLLAVLAFWIIGVAVAGVLLGGRYYVAERVQEAVVLPDSAPVKEGPDANYQSSFGVHAGLRVRITEKEQDWVRVRLSNGLEGWLREQDLGRL